MKKLLWLFLTGMIFSCNNEGSAPKEAAKDSTTAASTPNYPYTIEHPDYWEIGSTANTMTVLSALKSWEEGKMDESVKNFSDSVHVQFDGLDKTVPADTLKAMFTSSWNNYKNLHIKMTDWESVISKDKKEEWVTLWYTQHWENQKGEKDSADIINDLELKNGKIMHLAEYTRKTHR